jgi:hypothetical protein
MILVGFFFFFFEFLQASEGGVCFCILFVVDLNLCKIGLVS